VLNPAEGRYTEVQVWRNIKAYFSIRMQIYHDFFLSLTIGSLFPNKATKKPARTPTRVERKKHPLEKR
jgi:hypothetical protein